MKSKFDTPLIHLLKQVILATLGGSLLLIATSIGHLYGSDQAHIEARTPIHSFLACLAVVVVFHIATRVKGRDTVFSFVAGMALAYSVGTAIAAFRLGEWVLYLAELASIFAVMGFCFIYPYTMKNESHPPTRDHRLIRDALYFSTILIVWLSAGYILPRMFLCA